ncbi:Uncharacterized protein SCG7086_AB_00510 [Chlamydiales bacterium SCGC AG-110-P3]|nr:Uncharacterized protein SCG7086_AB_00510 [Chlamydiales bacterium SCGC AG-110-P3]
MRSNILIEILHNKVSEVDRLRKELDADPGHPLRKTIDARNHQQRSDFSEVVSAPGLSVIAEIKRKSPSAGHIADMSDPAAHAARYASAGAAAISVLTDYAYFGGSLNDLEAVANKVSVPILRKDFIIDRLQIAEAAYHGASAVLLIVKVLGEDVANMLHATRQYGLEALCEVSDANELAMALDAGARIVCANARDLRNFSVDIDRAIALRSHIPDGVLTVAASGISSQKEAYQLACCGYDAILVGQSLSQLEDPSELLQSLQVAPRPFIKMCGITCVEDARLAIEAGSNFVGVIATPGYPRSVTAQRAASVAQLVSDFDARAVAVFVDEGADEIIQYCDASGIDVVQLHGEHSRSAYDVLRGRYTIFYVVDKGGASPKLEEGDFLISAHERGKLSLGSQARASDALVLAGGLDPGCVRSLINDYNPVGVDVSRGIESTQMGRKDPLLVKQFVEEVYNG